METFEELVARFETEIQGILAQEVPDGDFSIGTVNYDLVVKPSAIATALRAQQLEVVRDNLSLVQVLNSDDPDATLVDLLLSNFNVVRTTGVRTTGLINIYTKTTQNVFINQNTIFTCGGVQLQPVKNYVGVTGEITQVDTESVSYVPTRDLGESTYVFSLTAISVVATDAVLSAGLVCSIAPPNSLVSRAEIGSSFIGGQLPETSAQLLDRAGTNINARVISGKDHIKSFLTSQSNIQVLDAAAFGMGDAEMLRDQSNNVRISNGGTVDVYIETGAVPSTAIASLTAVKRDGTVWAIDIPRETFPGAYGVLSIQYQDQLIVAAIGIELSFAADDDTAPLMNEAIHARYSAYQVMTAVIDTTAIPDTLDEADVQVEVLYMPGVGVVQDLLSDPSVRNYSFDILAKGVIPVITSVHVDIEYPAGIQPPTVGDVQQVVANQINSLGIGVEGLLTSEIIASVKNLFPEGEVQMPVRLFGRIFLPDGTQAYSESENHLKVDTGEGYSADNSAFFCFPSAVDVTLTEVI
jgi:hypothetical protein